MGWEALPTDLSTIPAKARPQTTPKSAQPHAPRSTPSVNGVYEPAISRKIDAWSMIRKTRLALPAGSAWYSVDAR